MAYKMAQDSGRRVKMASDARPGGLMTATKRFQVPSEAPKDPPKRPKSFSNLRKINGVCLIALSPPKGPRGLKMAPGWPKAAPRGAQTSPKTAPRAPNN
eukprot:1655448-Pyramimonas_sp.AAC.1